MAGSSKQQSSPLSLISVRLLLVSCAPLLSPAFLVPTTSPHQHQRQQQQQHQSRFVDQAAASLFAPPVAATASTANPWVALVGRNCHGTSTASTEIGSESSSRGRGDGMAMCGWHAATGTRTATTTATSVRRQLTLPILSRSPSSSCSCSSSGNRSKSRISSGGTSLLVLRAGGGGRVGGDSSRRRTDRPDEYSGAERKKRKGRGSGGGFGRGKGGGRGRGRGEGEVRPSKSAPPKDQEGELWGGESRLSSLEDKVEAEFSRKIDCSELSRKPKFYTIEATERESAALASRFSVEVITGLKADLRVLRAANPRKINIKGRVLGDVRQFCAKTLEPFEVSIAREFDTIVQEVSLDSVESTLWALEEDTETDEEIMEGDPLDLGEVAAQALALCIDPYATHPSVPREGGDGGDAGGVYKAYSGFGQPPAAEDEVIDVDAMRAFFDADD